jgi:hypothetical protein
LEKSVQRNLLFTDSIYLQPPAYELLHQQLAGAHLQLKEQETLTIQALSKKRILQGKLNFLAHELENRDRIAAARERPDRDLKSISETLDKRGDMSKFHGRRPLQAERESISPLGLRSRRPYVCLIIDGDANHFLPALLQAGGCGGEVAAERVKREGSQFVAERNYIPQSCILKVQVFMSRAGFVDFVSRCDRIPKDLINACLNRFFQSQPYWDLVDTGGLKESADTKIKGRNTLPPDDPVTQSDSLQQQISIYLSMTLTALQ